MKLAGGHPALDFVNTVDCRAGDWGPDVLVDYAALVDLALRVRLIDAGLAGALLAVAMTDPTAAIEALERARLFREALYRLFRVEGEGGMPAAEDTALLNAWTLRALNRRTLGADANGALEWRWVDGVDLDAVICRLALCATNLLLDQDRRRVRACPGPRCGWLFLDTTKGGRRLWCASETCGTRVRVARFRAAG